MFLNWLRKVWSYLNDPVSECRDWLDPDTWD